MALAAMLAGIDDALYPVMRFLGRAQDRAPMFPFDPKNPGGLISAIDNPATSESAIATMRKLHYGAFYSKTGRKMGAGLAEKELMTMGAGAGGALYGRPIKGLSMAKSHFGSNFGKLGFGIAGGIGVYQAITAPRHHMMSAFVGGAGEALAFGIGDMLGTALGGPLLGYALGFATGEIGAKAGEGLQFFNDFNATMKHVNMGGNYKDTQVAYTMRQRAAQELGSSVMNARQYLGKEALLMHQ